MSMTRRSFLHGAAAGAAALALPLRLNGQEAYGGFQMGLQTYTLRDFNLDQTLSHLKDLGLQYAQFYGKHLPVTDDKAKIAEAQEKMKAAGVKILSWGVQGFSKDLEKNRKSFEFA